MRVSGQGSEVIKKCEHFEAFDEFMGSPYPPNISLNQEALLLFQDLLRLRIRPPLKKMKLIVKRIRQLLLRLPLTKKRSGKRVTSNTLPVQADKRRKKKLKKRADENNEEDRWLALFEMQNQMMRESQRREELFFNRLQEGEQNCKELIIGAIRELGNLFKKD